MILKLLNTFEGLKPLYDKDYEDKKKLKLGEVYEANIKVSRNPKFHRKYFALINTAWEYQNENTQSFFNNNIETFRKTVEVTAGHCERIYSIEKKEWFDIPKSISFNSIDELEFTEVYNSVREVILTIFLKGIDEYDFNKILENYG